MRANVQAAGVELKVGVACTPEDGSALHELIAAAEATLGMPAVALAVHPERPAEAPEWTPDDVTAARAAG